MAPVDVDFYAVLGVPRTATQDDLRRAYKDQALRHHPDKNPGAVDEATEKFKLVAEAYSVLKDEKSRADYDLCNNTPAASEFFTFEKAADLFNDVFGTELVGTLGRAARGIVSAPGAVLATAAQCCADLPGVRGAVAAGYESMLADAELRLDLEVRRLAGFDIRLDEAWCRVKEHNKASSASARKRQEEFESSWRHLRTAGVQVLLLGAALCVVLYMHAMWLLFLSIFPFSVLLGRMVTRTADFRSLLNSHAKHVAAEESHGAELRRALHAEQEDFAAQRRCVAQAREEFARLRAVATDAERQGPSLSQAFAVSSHLVGHVVGSVFGRQPRVE